MKEEFIPGIYNYCDRWCERCAFTSRCRNYESTGKLSTEQTDIDNKVFWETVSNNFQNAIALLHKIAEEQGIDLNNIPPEETAKYEEDRLRIKSAAKKHILSILCKEYRELVMPFLEERLNSNLISKTKELTSQLHLGIKTETEVVHTMAALGDYAEIIRWYLFFIDAKLQRALHGSMEDAEDNDGYPKDSDGSAKVAIIAVERSIAAWSGIYERMPEEEDIMLSVLSLLSRIRNEAMKTFPAAMLFKRPGFDDI